MRGFALLPVFGCLLLVLPLSAQAGKGAFAAAEAAYGRALALPGYANDKAAQEALAATRRAHYEAASTPAIAISEPTERSMPPVAMTNVIPTATMTIVATCVMFALKAPMVRKFGVKTTL